MFIQNPRSPHKYWLFRPCIYFGQKLDDYGDQDNLELTDVQDEITKLFRHGSVKVGDRSLVAKASTAGYDNDRSYVDIQFDFYDDIPKTEDDTPLMGDIDMELKEG